MGTYKFLLLASLMPLAVGTVFCDFIVTPTPMSYSGFLANFIVNLIMIFLLLKWDAIEFTKKQLLGVTTAFTAIGLVIDSIFVNVLSTPLISNYGGGNPLEEIMSTGYHPPLPHDLVFFLTMIVIGLTILPFWKYVFKVDEPKKWIKPFVVVTVANFIGFTISGIIFNMFLRF